MSSDSDDNEADQKSSSSSSESEDKEDEAASFKRNNGARSRLAALREKKKKAQMKPSDRLKKLRDKHQGKTSKKEAAVRDSMVAWLLICVEDECDAE